MQFGVTMFPADNAMDVAELGREAEARGFESLWFPEHTHMPTATKLNSAGTGPLADEYRRTLDQFVVLGAVAAATSRIKLGTGICLVIQRDPILLAKEVASVDFLSNGRLLFGIGAGWNRPEIENHGVPYARRFRVMRERIQAMKASRPALSLSEPASRISLPSPSRPICPSSRSRPSRRSASMHRVVMRLPFWWCL